MRVRAAGIALLVVAAVACQTARPGTEAAPVASTSAGVSPASSGSPTPTPAISATAQSAQCGQRITADFLLANDMTCTTDAFVINADNVTLDLGGRTITGPGMGPQTWPLPQLDSVGVRTGGHTNVTIRNGTISQFSTGIYFVDEVKSRIEDVTSERNRFGFYIHASSQNAIRRSTVVGNVYGLHLQDANDDIVEGNNLIRQTYNSPGGYGIYLYRSTGNRIVENTIENNVNWGIWFSDAKNNTIFHNNVAGNSPQVSDNNPDANHWYDAEKKEGNWWADYKGTDADNDLIGDTPYGILGPGGAVDAYPFVARDGWKKKTHSTIDHYQPPLARPPREVRLVVVSGGTVGIGRPHDSALAATSVHASSVAVQTDGRTLLALDGKTLTAWDLTGGEPSTRTVAIDGGIVGANRDGVSALIVGPRGAQQIDLVTGQQEFFDYTGVPQELAPSYKHNHIFVATPRGVELLYLNLGGRTPHRPARRPRRRDVDERVRNAHLHRGPRQERDRRRRYRAVRGRATHHDRQRGDGDRGLAWRGRAVRGYRERRARDRPRQRTRARAHVLPRIRGRPRDLAERRRALCGARRAPARGRGARHRGAADGEHHPAPGGSDQAARRVVLGASSARSVRASPRSPGTRPARPARATAGPRRRRRSTSGGRCHSAARASIRRRRAPRSHSRP